MLFDLYVASQQLLELELAGVEVPVEDFAIYNAIVHFERVTPTQLAQHRAAPLPGHCASRTPRLAGDGAVSRLRLVPR